MRRLDFEEAPPLKRAETPKQMIRTLSACVLAAARMASKLTGREVKGVVISDEGVRWVFEGGCDCHAAADTTKN